MLGIPTTNRGKIRAMEKQQPGTVRGASVYDLSNDLCVILKRCAMLEQRILDVESIKHLNFIRAAAEHMSATIADGPCGHAEEHIRVG